MSAFRASGDPGGEAAGPVAVICSPCAGQLLLGAEPGAAPCSTFNCTFPPKNDLAQKRHRIPDRTKTRHTLAPQTDSGSPEKQRKTSRNSKQKRFNRFKKKPHWVDPFLMNSPLLCLFLKPLPAWFSRFFLADTAEWESEEPSKESSECEEPSSVAG